MNLPLSIFYQCITGEYPAYDGLVDTVEADTDMFMQPDWSTLTAVPWAISWLSVRGVRHQKYQCHQSG